MFLTNLPISLTCLHEKYLQANKLEPIIQCKKCTIKQLDLGEFDGGLIGWALNSLAQGTATLETVKAIFDERLKIVSEGCFTEILDFMVRSANKTNQLCAGCHGKSDAWQAKFCIKAINSSAKSSDPCKKQSTIL